MTLANEIADWDGKSAKDIQRIYEHHADAAQFSTQITAWLSAPKMQAGASWLLKHHLEQGNSLAPDLVRDVYSSLSELSCWQARLHILQCISYLPIPANRTVKLKRFLDNCLDDEVKFVRAWAYHGFWELGRQHPRFRPQAEDLLEQGMQSESAAVKARIRNCLKQGF